MKVKQIILIALLLFSFSVSAETESMKKDTTVFKSFKDRICIGGSLGGSFGAYYDILEVSPYVGVYVSPYLLSGISLNYNYFGYGYEYDDGTGVKQVLVSDNYYGISPFVRYYLPGKKLKMLQNFFFDAHFEMLWSYVEDDTDVDPQSNQFAIPAVGVGYKAKIKERFGIICQLSYVFVDSESAPYRNPVLSFGFEF